MFRKRCPECGLVKEVGRRDQICCSRSCGMKWYTKSLTKEFKQKRSQKGGQAQGRNQAPRREARYEDLVAKHGLLKACRLIYRTGYAAGHRSRHYAECVEARRRG